MIVTPKGMVCINIIFLDFITRKTFGEEYRSLSPSFYTIFHSHVTSSLLDPYIFFGTLTLLDVNMAAPLRGNIMN